MKRSAILEIICSLIILLFLYTSVSKIMDFSGFIHDMHNQPFPEVVKPLLVYTIPPIEIGIALALLFERTKRIGLWASLILMSLFTLYTLTVLLHFFDRVPCSCGGVIRRLTWAQHMFLNLFFVIISLIGLYILNHPSSRQKELKDIKLSI